MAQVYDRLGVGYATHRRTDPRIAEAVTGALGGARRVVNVGAGTGSYEPRGARVVAIEPSTVMARARRPGSAPVVRAIAEDLPLRDGSFDAALAVFSLHHWSDQRRGLAEMRRVARRQVLLTFDPVVHFEGWLVGEYLPEIAEVPGSRPLAPQEIADQLGGAEVVAVPVPHDCRDGFLHAFWRRPEAYLDPQVQAASSGLASLPAAVRAAGLDRLRRDLESGAWHRRHADPVRMTQLDAGYRLVVAAGEAR